MRSLGLALKPEIREVWRFDESQGVGAYHPIETGESVVTLATQPTAADLPLLKAACRQAPTNVLAVHLGNLALHKRITKMGAQGVKALVEDCANLLSDLSEMAVVLAIRDIKLKDEIPYFPQLASIRKAAQDYDRMLAEALERAEAAARAAPQIEQPKPVYKTERAQDWRHMAKTAWDVWMWQAYIAEAEKMLALAQRNPGALSADDWTQALADRRNEAAMTRHAEELGLNTAHCP